MFGIVQTIAAIYAGSEAMVGDSAAMLVDSLTYLFNWFAERQKRAYAEKAYGRNVDDVHKLRYRKYHLQLELVPPLVSVSTLLVVIGFVLKKAVRVLILDSKRDVSLQSDPNVNLMMFFSFLNLLLDFLNVFCFAKAKHAMGYETSDEEDDKQPIHERLHLKSMRRLLDDDETGARHSNDEDDDMDHVESASPKRRIEPFEIENGVEEHGEGANLNMCSAYTHVFADTLRSLAVIIASLLADFVPTITPEEADATAAVVVSVLILLSLVPLVKGIIHTLGELRKVNDLLIEGLMDALDEDDYIEEEDDEHEICVN